MKRNQVYIALTGAAIMTFAIVACDKNLNKTDPNAVTVDQYFKTAAELQSGTNAFRIALLISFRCWLIRRQWKWRYRDRNEQCGAC